MYILPRIKRIAACSLAILLTLGALGLTKNDNSVTIHATQDQSQYAQKIDDLSDKQASLEKKIADADASIKGQQEKLNNVSEQMSVISQKIKVSQKYSEQIEDEMCRLDEQMRDTQYKLSGMEDSITKNVNEFMKRIRAMYIAGTDSYTSIIANAADFYDVLMRTELIKRVAEHDNKIIDELTQQKKQIDKQQEKLESQSKSLKDKSKEYAAQQKVLADEYQNLVEMQNSYGESIAALQNDKSKYQDEINKVIEEYSDEAKQAQAYISTTTTVKTEAETAKTTTKKTTEETEKKTTTKKQSASTTTTKKSSNTTTTKNTSNTPSTTTKKTTTTTKKTTTAPATKPPTSDSDSSYDSKIDILMSTARSMVGASYVWGAATPTATDCSGLTMQCYAKIGISLPHKASAQANYGTSVSYSNMKKGDLIFFGGSSYSSIYHVAIYIGDGKMIHAENQYTGVVISYVSSFSKYNNITCIKRLI